MQEQPARLLPDGDHANFRASVRGRPSHCRLKSRLLGSPSATRQSHPAHGIRILTPNAGDSRLCVPASRQVCLYRAQSSSCERSLLRRTTAADKLIKHYPSVFVKVFLPGAIFASLGALNIYLDTRYARSGNIKGECLRSLI